MQKIEVSVKEKNLDSTGASVKSDIQEDLGINGVEETRFSEVYYLDLPINEEEAREIAEKAFTDPLIQIFSINKELFSDYDFIIEVKLHEDVTDNTGIIALEAVQDFLGKKFDGKVRVSRKYYFEGNVSKENAERIAKELLANEIIEKYGIVMKNG